MRQASDSTPRCSEVRPRLYESTTSASEARSADPSTHAAPRPHSPYRPRQRVVPAPAIYPARPLGLHDERPRRDVRRAGAPVPAGRFNAEQCVVLLRCENHGLWWRGRLTAEHYQIALIKTLAALFPSVPAPPPIPHNALKYGPNVTLSFVLLNEDAALGEYVRSWDIEGAIRGEWSSILQSGDERRTVVRRVRMMPA